MTGLFTTREAEAAYFSLYDRVLSLWPVEHEPLDIPTTLGTTHLNVAGLATNPPLLLFPGFGSNSTMYWPNIGDLAKQRLVYAVDTIGQPGRSVPTGALTPANCDGWIDEIVSALAIQSADLMGLSLGGWLSLHYAIHRPEAGRKVILLDPAATFLPMSSAFILRSILPFMIRPTRRGLTAFFRWISRGYAVHSDYGEMMVQGTLNTRWPPLRAAPFADAELMSVTSPTLLVVGDKSLIYDSRKVVERARRVVSNLEVETIPDGSHALTMEQAGAVNSRVSAFLAQ
jgi:pimeloyl-ACP methyl ester carboxylesterase